MAHLKRFPCSILFFMGSLLAVVLIIGFLGSTQLAAAAGTPYGIQGQMAPELNLFNWIDGNGRKMDDTRLRDYLGKVIYLYFFQDW